MHGETRLADATDTGQRDDAVFVYTLHELRNLIVATDRNRPKVPSFTWNSRSADIRSRRRCSPRSIHSIEGLIKPRVAAEARICPPWPTAMMRAARFTAGPK